MTKKSYSQDDVTEETKRRIFMRLCPEKGSTFKSIVNKFNKIFKLETHKELNIFIGELKKHMNKEYQERSNFIIINGERFSNGDSVKTKLDKIRKKEKRTPEERLFVRECIKYHPEITKIKNYLYRDTNEHGRKKIERIIFLDGDIFLKLEGIKKLNNFKKSRIYNALKNKIIPVKGIQNFKIQIRLDDENPSGFETSLTDCNNFLIKFLKEYYRTDYPNAEKIVYGRFNKKLSLLVQDVYDNLTELRPLKDIFDKDKSKYCQGYLILNEQGNFVCSFCNHIVVKNTINIAYPTYNKKGTGLKDANKVSSIEKMSYKAWKEKTTKDLEKQLEEAIKSRGKELIKEIDKKIKKWTKLTFKKRKDQYDQYKNK